MEYLRKELGYDDSDEKSIFSFALKLCYKSFMDIMKSNGFTSEDAIKTYNRIQRKGGLGNLVEEVYFGFKANSEQEADFPKVGIELKVTPYERNKNGSFSAGERLVITMIGFNKAVEDDFEKSHVWNKIKRMLLIYYFRDKERWSNNLDYPINYVSLFTPPKIDLEVIKNDYLIINRKIKEGRAHELSESDTQYLGACTKGDNSSRMVPQFYGSHILAKTRAFCYKQSYMTYVLRYYIIGEAKDVEVGCIIKNVSELQGKTFTEILQERIGKYIGRESIGLAKEFGVNTDNKGMNAPLVYKLLGVNGNKAEEFIKANIKVKTIRINKEGIIEQHFRLSDVSLSKMAQEEWESSEFYSLITTTSFLLVVFREQQNGEYVLKGSQLWHIPHNDYHIIQNGWTAVRDRLKEGVNFVPTVSSNGSVVIKNDIPKSTDNSIYHIRPHQTQTYYQLKDGSVFGKGSVGNSDILLDGQRMTTQSNWFHKNYMLSQLREDLKS